MEKSNKYLVHLTKDMMQDENQHGIGSKCYIYLSLNQDWLSIYPTKTILLIYV